jgi:hypothetical protein
MALKKTCRLGSEWKTVSGQTFLYLENKQEAQKKLFMQPLRFPVLRQPSVQLRHIDVKITSRRNSCYVQLLIPRSAASARDVAITMSAE